MIVIGPRPPREVAAGRLADKGYEVTIVEAELVGGQCPYYACMPSKSPFARNQDQPDRSVEGLLLASGATSKAAAAGEDSERPARRAQRR